MQREEEAVKLRIAGKTMQEIADALGISKPAVLYRIDKAIARSLAIPEREQLRSIELARLEVMHKAVWEKAAKGNRNAIADVLRIMERRAKLCGLDILRVSVGDADIDDLISGHLARLATGSEGQALPAAAESNTTVNIQINQRQPAPVIIDAPKHPIKPAHTNTKTTGVFKLSQP
jgi:predicted DNA binding protein